MSHHDLVPTILLTAGTLISLVTLAEFFAGAAR